MEFDSVKKEDDAKEGEEGEEFWTALFKRLDKMDGTEDNKLPKTTLLAWLSTLDFQGTVSLEVHQGITR